MGTRVEFASGVQMFLPEKDALVAQCHAQTISAFDARPVSRFAGNWAEIFFLIEWMQYQLDPKN